MSLEASERRSLDQELPQPKGLDVKLWEAATPEQKQVLAKIARQRDRLKAKNAAQAQAQALRQTKGEQQVLADDPLPLRLMAFVRLHPVATAAAGALLMVLGPRKLMRWGGVAIPWIVKFQQQRNR
ncbi:hypothetical protein DZC30_01510 [Comamonas testosteroni]|uniref:Uncharacterized protein n=1 Tax=Comamonas testosteroni TaxID=285 RepID=A0A373FSH0_COMTE|nr:hypothetical protein [Comamonas testosteroni]RGE47096.1 hypothetical protein DZC30_01510 [Comamonas testosteroni]